MKLKDLVVFFFFILLLNPDQYETQTLGSNTNNMNEQN